MDGGMGGGMDGGALGEGGQEGGEEGERRSKASGLARGTTGGTRDEGKQGETSGEREQWQRFFEVSGERIRTPRGRRRWRIRGHSRGRGPRAALAGGGALHRPKVRCVMRARACVALEWMSEARPRTSRTQPASTPSGKRQDRSSPKLS